MTWFELYIPGPVQTVPLNKLRRGFVSLLECHSHNHRAGHILQSKIIQIVSSFSICTSFCVSIFTCNRGNYKNSLNTLLLQLITLEPVPSKLTRRPNLHSYLLGKVNKG